MTALVSGAAHLFALLRGLADWLRERQKEKAIRADEANRITAETQATTREAEHAANEELARPSDRGDLVGRLRRSGL